MEEELREYLLEKFLSSQKQLKQDWKEKYTNVFGINENIIIDEDSIHKMADIADFWVDSFEGFLLNIKLYAKSK